MPGRHHGAAVEWGHLEGAERAVPDQCRGVVDRGMNARGRLRADVEDHAFRGDGVEAIGVGRRIGGEMKRHYGIDRQDDGTVRRIGLLDDPQRGRGQVFLGERLADLDALRMQERIGHAAADHQRVDLGDEILQQVDLGGNLGAADDPDHGLGGGIQCLGQRVELGLHGASGIGRQFVTEAFGGSVRPVRRRERVVDPDVAELCEASHEGGIVLFFLFVEAGIFQAEDVAVFERGDGISRDVANAIIGKGDRLVDDARERRGDRFQRLLGIAPLGPAEMRQQDHLAALAGDFGDRGRNALKPRGIGDAAIFGRHVEVDAQQHALAFHVDVIEGAELFHAVFPALWPGIAA